MFLQDVYDALCAAEFQLSSIGDTGDIPAEKKSLVNTVIQAGITDINKYFTIREGELVLQTKVGKNTYELVPENAVSSGNPSAFILDSLDDPFKGDILQIQRISDSTGRSIWLNTDVPYRVELENAFGKYPRALKHSGINMLSYNTLRFAQDHEADSYLVNYKAKLKPIAKDAEPTTTYLDLPDHYLNALCNYVASRFFNPKGAETIGRGMFHEGNNYWSKYKEDIETLRANMASIASTGETTKFETGGWV